MSSLIERAAHRLEQLRQAGVVVPDAVAPQAASAPPVEIGAVADAAVSQTLELPLRPQAASPQLKTVELDLDALEAAGFVTPRALRSLVAAEIRVIKRPLISNATGKGAVKLTHGNLIMITSALPGEGKSFTAVNLAMSIAAELDHTVMLVDADVARPSVLRLLGLPASRGLLDLLDGNVDMSSVLLKTNVDKLTILPSGTSRAHATELLASDAMRLLLDEISRRYPERIVIFDSPPLLLTTEARVLAAQMGQVVMVVHADKTLQSSVQHALSTIESCPMKMMVLNKMRVQSAGGYGYGYGYGNGYGYGYGYGQGQGAGH